MKTRHGFMSNSSSSSFVIAKNNKYPTIWDVAMAMIALREWTEDEYLINLCKRYKRSISNRMTPVKNLCFPTCNFSTYIHDNDIEWWISTCNNHPFSTIFHDQLLEVNLAHSKSPLGDYNLMEFIEFAMPTYFDYFVLD